MISAKSGWSKSTSFFIDFIGIVTLFLVLKELQEIFIPFTIAYFLFFVFSPINNYLVKYKVPLFLAILLDLLILIFFVGSISSVIIDSFSRFGEQFPVYESKLNGIISSTAVSLGINDPLLIKFSISDALSRINLSLLAGDVFSSTFSFIGSLLFVIFFFIFVNSGHQKLYNSIRKRYIKKYIRTNLKRNNEADDQGKSNLNVEKKIIAEQGDEILSSTFQEITAQVQKYITTKFVMSLIMAIAVGIVLFIAGVDFPVVWVVITFAFHFIPNIGSIIAVLLPCLMALIQYESLGFAIFLALILILIQNIIGNILEPKIFGHRLGLNPIIVLLSLLLWGYIWGVAGMILSVPLTSIIKIMVARSESPNLKFLNTLMS